MCEQSAPSTAVWVEIPADLACEGVEKWKLAQVDPCIASIVRALQIEDIDMRGSCCGHGRGAGHIHLQDGRGLVVLSAEQNAEFLVSGRLPCAR